MHFWFFAAQYLPTIGGVERYTQNLAAAVVGMGHGATVITSALPGLPAREVDENGVQVLRLPARLWLGGRLPGLRKNAQFRRLAAELLASPCDLAVINTRFYPLSLWAAKACSKNNVPALILDHSSGHLSLGGRLLDIPVHWYEHWAMRRVKRQCGHFYGVSQGCVDWLGHFGVQANGVLYNAVNPARLQALAAASAYDPRAAFGIAPDAPLAVFSGRLIPEKGVFQLLDAFPLVRQRLPGAALVLAGGGPSLEALKTKQVPGVYFAGPLDYADNLALVATADAYCLPTRYAEGFPTGALEAAALKTPVVCTTAGGLPELVRDGESGLFVDGHSPQSIADGLLRALSDDAWRAGATKAAYARLCERFTWQRTAGALIKIAEKDGGA